MPSGMLEDFSDAVQAIKPYCSDEAQARAELQKLLSDSGFDRLLFNAAVEEYVEELEEKERHGLL